MRATRAAFPSPVLLIEDFLPVADAAAILQECIDLRADFVPAAVGNGAETRVDPTHRRNAVCYLDHHSITREVIQRRVWEDDCRELWQQGESILEVVNYHTTRESVLSRYDDGDFFGRHRDTMRDPRRPADVTRRIVSLVYYVQFEPAQFTGGELVLAKDGEELIVTPKHNFAVVFHSFCQHEVRRVSLSSSAWEDGRFSLNHWMGFWPTGRN